MAREGFKADVSDQPSGKAWFLVSRRSSVVGLQPLASFRIAFAVRNLLVAVFCGDTSEKQIPRTQKLFGMTRFKANGVKLMAHISRLLAES